MLNVSYVASDPVSHSVGWCPALPVIGRVGARYLAGHSHQLSFVWQTAVTVVHGQTFCCPLSGRPRSFGNDPVVSAAPAVAHRQSVSSGYNCTVCAGRPTPRRVWSGIDCRAPDRPPDGGGGGGSGGRLVGLPLPLPPQLTAAPRALGPESGVTRPGGAEAVDC